MSENWQRHMVTAHHAPYTRGWRGVIAGPAPDATLDNAMTRPLVWQCEHRHRLARQAITCAEAEAKRRGGRQYRAIGER